jgi:hypothetical protein
MPQFATIPKSIVKRNGSFATIARNSVPTAVVSKFGLRTWMPSQIRRSQDQVLVEKKKKHPEALPPF